MRIEPGPLHDLITKHGFDRYQIGLRARFNTPDLKYELTYCKSTDNPAMLLDFENAQCLGRVTAWESGMCDLEVLDLASGNIVFYEHHELHEESEFHAVYPRLVLFMRTGKPTLP